MSALPFDIKAKSISPFPVLVNGYNFSYTGIQLYFKRNTLGLLIGSFYEPTAIFSIFSMLSYNIKMEMVNFVFKNSRKHTKLHTFFPEDGVLCQFHPKIHETNQAPQL